MCQNKVEKTCLTRRLIYPKLKVGVGPFNFEIGSFVGALAGKEINTKLLFWLFRGNIVFTPKRIGFFP